MANINGNTIPGGVDWSGISNALYNTLQQPYNQRQTQPGGYNYNDPNDTGGGIVTPTGYQGSFDSFASDNQAINGPGYYQGQQIPNAAGSINNAKDQSRLASGLPGQAFAYQMPQFNNPLAALGNAMVGGLKALPPASMIRKLAPQAQALPRAHPAPHMQQVQPRGLAAMPAPVLTKVQQFQAQGLSPSQAYTAAASTVKPGGTQSALQSAQNPNGAVYAAITGNSGSGQIRGGAIA